MIVSTNNINNKHHLILFTTSPEQTEELGYVLAGLLKPNSKLVLLRE